MEASLMRGTALDSGGDNKESVVMADALDVRSFNTYASQLAEYPRHGRGTTRRRRWHIIQSAYITLFHFLASSVLWVCWHAEWHCRTTESCRFLSSLCLLCTTCVFLAAVSPFVHVPVIIQVLV